jgi:hypothetical protein
MGMVLLTFSIQCEYVCVDVDMHKGGGDWT